MRKTDEIKNTDSCLNQSRSDEMLFVLCARDKAAPIAILLWVQIRITLGLNKWKDDKIQEALYTAQVMQREL